MQSNINIESKTSQGIYPDTFYFWQKREEHEYSEKSLEG